MDTGAYFVGALGAFLVFLAWIPITREALRAKRIPAEFELLMFFGAVLLTIYSYWLNDVIFTILNLGVAILAFVNLEYLPRKRARNRVLARLEQVQRELERLELETISKPKRVTKKRTATKKKTTRKTTAKKKTTKRKTTRKTKKKPATKTKKKTSAKKKTTKRKTTRKKK